MNNVVYSVYIEEFYGKSATMTLRIHNNKGIICNINSHSYKDIELYLEPTQMKVLIDTLKNQLTLYSLSVAGYIISLSVDISSTSLYIKHEDDLDEKRMEFTVDRFKLHNTLKYLHEEITKQGEE